jgi:hypothetical protein
MPVAKSNSARGGAAMVVLAVMGVGALTIPACNNRNAPAPGTPAVKSTASNSGAGYTPAAEEKFDPIKENGPIFEKWPKPELTLVFTGEQHGYFEPCGCAGPGRQKGGMSRRHSFLKKLTDDGWNPVPIDLGGVSRSTGEQAVIKLRTSLDSLKKMNYRAIGLAGDDLRFPPEDLISATVNDEGSLAPFVSANVVVLGMENRFLVVDAGGAKIGVTSVVAGKQRDALVESIDPGTTIEDPAEALKNVVPQLKDAGCDFLILLSYATPDETRALAEQFPDFDYVVTAGGPDEPPAEAAALRHGAAKLIQLGHKGMYAVAIGLYGKDKFRYQRVPLDSRFADSPEMHELMVGYQDQLKTLGWEGLGVSGVLHERAQGADDANAQFVGADACGKCHSQAYSVWKGSKHSHATETLTKLDPPRQFDPECIACHATGWDSEHYVPFLGGFDSIATTAHLAGNSCENCHGPGSGHVAAEAARDPKVREEMRSLMRLNLAIAEQKTCRGCHDLDNSPTFDFKTYWEKIKHPGKN